MSGYTTFTLLMYGLMYLRYICVNTKNIYKYINI